MRRPLLINGFMGSGKSSVGPRVALRASRPFIDLDQRIEAHVGLPVAEIFKQRGEAEFRRIEGELLRMLLARGAADPSPVVALGGGALLRKETRLLALDQAVVVTLQASFAEITRRIGSDPRRPALAGDPEALLELRQRAYAEAHARVPTDGRTLDAIADDVFGIWERDALAVAVGEQSYSVEIGRNLLGRLPALASGASRVLLITDQNVYPLHGARVTAAFGPEARPVIVELTPGEEHKHVGSVERIWRAALDASMDRSSIFVSLGGGVASDITGFAAATYMRGVPWLCVPTTLLAMVDASVGGKTGVDLQAAKNAVGAFHQPRAVVCDVDLLATESLRGFRSALAEVVKTALIGDADLLDYLETNAAVLTQRDPALLMEIVRRSIRVKARIVSLDERESGPRAKLNLGHTIGHALEANAGYSRLSHGEAISLGLVAALRLGVRLGVTPQALADRVHALLDRLGLPTDLRAENLAQALKLVGHDKKRAGKKLKFVIARGPENVETMDIELERVKELALGLVHPG
jgi:shikimate kinase/3-dehydroquinate synthase